MSPNSLSLLAGKEITRSSESVSLALSEDLFSAEDERGEGWMEMGIDELIRGLGVTKRGLLGARDRALLSECPNFEASAHKTDKMTGTKIDACFQPPVLLYLKCSCCSALCTPSWIVLRSFNCLTDSISGFVLAGL